MIERLTADNPKSRRHTETYDDGHSSWGCIPLRDAVAAREELRRFEDVDWMARGICMAECGALRNGVPRWDGEFHDKFRDGHRAKAAGIVAFFTGTRP